MRRSTLLPPVSSQDIDFYPVRRDLPLPLHTPPPTAQPSLPSPPREPRFSSAYTLSTHIVQAAYPRTHPDVPVPELPGPTASKDERKKAFRAASAHALKTRLAYEDGAFEGERSTKPFWLVVNRYVNKNIGSQGHGLTLFFGHANAFTKEYWEPVIDRVLSSLSGASGAPVIDEIWSLDFANSGDSAILNLGSLSGLYDWADCTRDILHILLGYLPDAASAVTLPTHLQRLPTSVAEARQARGFNARTVVGVGHSIGATTMMLAARAHPALFSSLLLVDPVIGPPVRVSQEALQTAMSMAISRRERWPSRADALKSFQAIPFYARWDAAALALYVECGLCADGRAEPGVDGPVKLKMPSIQEGICFEGRTSHEAWELVATLDARVAVHFVLAAQESIFSGPMALRRELAWRRPGNASNCVLECGHLIVQEAPRELADELSAFLLRKYSGDTLRSRL